jgi:hypothetical protein
MKFELRWSDIGRAQEPGIYPFRGGRIQIKATHLTAWQLDPDGAWEIASVVRPRGAIRYVFRNFRSSGTNGLRPDQNVSDNVG